MERTLVIIKPDAVKDKHIGEIINRFEKQGFEIIAMKMLQMTEDEAENFYYIHRGKEFFEQLIKFMTSGPCVLMVIQGKNIIKKVRDFIGATDPKKAEKGTIRADFGSSITENAVHASDSLESAKFEVNFFFPEKAF